MTSHAHVHFEQGEVTLQEWIEWCGRMELAWSAGDPSGNVWRKGGRGGIEAIFGEGNRRTREPTETATNVMFMTEWGGDSPAELAALARAFWVRFGGSMWAEEGIRKLICRMQG